MKTKILLTLLVVILAASNMYAQKTVQILGTTFSVHCNNDDMTAEICDYEHRIDTHKYPMYVYKRRIKNTYSMKKGKLIIPETVIVDGQEYLVTGIGRAAFADYRNFTSVEIPTSVEYIGELAFCNTKLKSVEIPSSVVSIGDYAFYRTPLQSVKINGPVESVGNRAFGLCPFLKSLELPYGGIAAMGNDVYTESKNIIVSMSEDQAMMLAGNSVRPMPQKPKKIETKPIKAKPMNVDVDMNIPLSSKTNEHTFVVVIANENYTTESKVHYAINDGRVFKEYCKSTLGVPETNIHIVEDATLNNMRNEINWLGRVASVYEGDARIIIYYAGHGIPDEATGSAYLLPVDGVGTDVQTGYSLKSFYAELGKMSAQNVTVFMDACFSGSQRGEGMLASSRGVAIAAKEEVPTGNLVVFSATQKDETAFPYDEKGHGLFTYFLLKKLQETKGDVTYEELGTYLKKQVSRHAIVVNNKPQTPSMSSSGSMSGKIKSMKLK